MTHLYFTAVDHDCDGTTTTILRVAVPPCFRLASDAPDTMPQPLYDHLFPQGNYFGASDLFVIRDMDDSAVERLLDRSHTVWNDERPDWYPCIRYDTVTLAGNAWA